MHEDVFLIPKNATSERPIALMPTSIRRWEAMKASAVMKWQQRYLIERSPFFFLSPKSVLILAQLRRKRCGEKNYK